MKKMKHGCYKPTRARGANCHPLRCSVRYDYPMKINARGRAVSTRRGRPLICPRIAFARGLCKMHLRSDARAARSSAARELRAAKAIEALLRR